MNDGQNAKQQLVERIKSSSTILVTVSTNPTVDELSAAMGLTVMLNGMNKHATAVVSGDIPPAITFLEPAKIFENTVDSLRDFIIALDKEKADHLRYKVDGDVVKIFITPYRTTLSADDLEFSQGDYNVELVIALGVSDKEHLDKALSAHGRILHDATVATLSCGDAASQLGSIDWYESGASSLSEMLVALSEALKGDKPLLNEQSATAYLTGIVAATDRFSNNHTSSKVMTMAAQLMAAGANQQLIAAKLEEAHEIGPTVSEKSESVDNSDGSTSLEEGESTKITSTSASASGKSKSNDGSLAVSHEKSGTVDEVAQQTGEENSNDAAKKAEDELSEQLGTVAPTAIPSVADIQSDIANSANSGDGAADEAVLPPVAQAQSSNGTDAPSLGGTLNATTEEAHQANQQAVEDDRNKTILSHNSEYVGDSQPAFQAPFNATSSTVEEPKSVDIFQDAKPEVDLNKSSASGSPFTPPVTDETAAPMETLEELDKKNRKSEHQDAQAAVSAAFDAAPFDPAHKPTVGNGAQQLGDVTHGANADGLVYEPTASASSPLPPPPELPPLPPVEPLAPVSVSVAPDFSSLPPPPPLPPAPMDVADSSAPEQRQSGAVPPEQLGALFGSPAPQATPEPPSNDPNQFKIPGQQ